MCLNYFFYVLGDDDGAVILVYWWWAEAAMLYRGVGWGAAVPGIVCKGWRRI